MYFYNPDAEKWNEVTRFFEEYNMNAEDVLSAIADCFGMPDLDEFLEHLKEEYGD